jgi:hypothetical protein
MPIQPRNLHRKINFNQEAERCPTCGGMVFLPCLKCTAEKQKKVHRDTKEHWKV